MEGLVRRSSVNGAARGTAGSSSLPLACKAEVAEETAGEAPVAINTQALVGLLVIVNANDPVVKEFSRSQSGLPYQVSSVVLVASLLSVLGGMAATCRLHGFCAGVRQCFDFKQLCLCCVPSVLFTYSSVLRFSALKFIGADVLAVTEPIFGLAASTLAERVLKGCVLQRRQVGALLLAVLGLCWFLALGSTSSSTAFCVPSMLGYLHMSSQSKFCDEVLSMGWLCMLGSAGLGTLAGFSAECFLKRGRADCNPTVAFLVQKTQLEVPAFFAALLASVVLEPLLDPPKITSRVPRGLFEGWDAWTLAVLGAVLARSWLAAGVVKHLDTLRYSLAQVLAMLLTLLELEVLSGLGRSTPGTGSLVRMRSRLSAYAAMALVALAMGTFSLSAPPSAETVSIADSTGLTEPLMGTRHRRKRSRSKRSADVGCWGSCLGGLSAGVVARFRHHAVSIALVFGYVAADTGKMLLVSWAHCNNVDQETFLPSSLLVVQLCVSALIALGITGAKMGLPGLRTAVRPWNVLRCAPVATFFFVSKMCTVASLEHVDAGTVKLSTQLILPCSALLSVCLIAGRSYSPGQWVSIVTICLATLAFHAVLIEAETATILPQAERALRRRARLVGLFLCGCVVLANSLGSVLGERLLKGEKSTPLACLKARLVLAELLVVVLVLEAIEAPAKGGRWFAGWNWRVVICALGWVPATWMSTLITARFSTVVKNLMQCLSTLVTYFLAFLDPSHIGHSPVATLLAFVVMLSVSTFSLQNAEEPEPDAAPSGQDAEISDGSATRSVKRRLRSGGKHLKGATSILDLVSYIDLRRSETEPLGSAYLDVLQAEYDFPRRSTC